MSLLNSASLVVTPNGYKEGTLYSVIPNTTLGDMTVVRATTATRVNSAGLVELVPYNLLTWSEQFNNADWALSSATISTNAITAPNDTLTADKFIATATNAVHFFQQSSISSSYVFSIYAKAGEENVFSMWIANTSKRAEFNLTTGTIPLSTVANSSIVNVGNGWYRCSVYDSSPTTTYRIYGRTGSSYLGNGVDGMFFWGAQLNDGTTAKDYLRTETRLNIPRLDYSNGSCPSLLVEPQRTNLVLYSEQFNNAAWTTSAFNATVTANTTISPDGTQNADTVVFGASGYLYQQFAITGLASVTFSIYSKTATQVIVFGGGTPVGTDVYTTVNVGNGWFRQILVRTFTGGGTGTLQTLPFANNITAFLWGCQIEAGSYPTSYIPTTSAAVTRNADQISKTGISSLIGQTEGVLFMDINWQQKDGVYFINSISDGTTDNEIMMAFGSTDNNRLRFSIVNGGSASVSFDSTALASGRYKVAFAYANNDAVAYINGTQVFTDNTVSVPSTSEMKFLRANNTLGYSGTINASALWKTRLTNAELISLTT